MADKCPFICSVIKYPAIYLEKSNLFFNLCAYKVQTFTEMLSRKVEGLDPLKP
jgi:hypothetical protein